MRSIDTLSTQWKNSCTGTTVLGHICPLNLDVLETPEKAFYRKAQDIMLGNFLRLMENMQLEVTLPNDV